MEDSKLLRVGGYLSGGVLILFGIVVIALGIYGFTFTRDSIEEEGIAGIGFVLLARAVFGRRAGPPPPAPAAAA